MRNIRMWSFLTLPFSELVFRETSLENKIVIYSLYIFQKSLYLIDMCKRWQRELNLLCQKIITKKLKNNLCNIFVFHKFKYRTR